ncbi:ABC transporter ATP-binding protein [Bacillus bingmayongensis]|uniref:ABC transporter ATP-binding protein n=1 Tax=Bacillus bingmayongensis TaxID=1150157 RepID=UPI001C8DEB7D|nr:ABC transporter ATP-binding protein [Bacillus bingmayongensis]MBY0594973.1 ABC transporter ATP-binding protein [Bacillus bingmayongensis]
MLDKFSLQIHNLSHSYENKIALNNINWTLNAGNIYVLLGPNGAGKTTFLNLLANAIKPTSGNITLVNSKGININESLQENIGYLTEFPYFYPFLTTTEMIRLVGQLKGVEANFLENQIEKWIDLFGLYGYRNNTMESLSQGTKKRVTFITSIIHQPRIILLDEPTNGLDPEQIVLFRDVLKELSKDGALILLSTHIMDLAEKLADNIGIIRNNSLIYTGENTKNLEDLYLTIQ